MEKADLKVESTKSSTYRGQFGLEGDELVVDLSSSSRHFSFFSLSGSVVREKRSTVAGEIL